MLGLHIQRVRRHNDAKDGADLRCAQVIERARVAVSDKDGRARGHRLPTAHTATRYGNLPHHCRLHDPPEWLSPLCSCRRLGIAVCHVCGACSASKFTFTRLNFKFNISFPGSHKFRMRSAWFASTSVSTATTCTRPRTALSSQLAGNQDSCTHVATAVVVTAPAVQPSPRHTIVSITGTWRYHVRVRTAAHGCPAGGKPAICGSRGV